MRYHLFFLEGRHPAIIATICFLIFAAVAVADYNANPELSTSIFYVIPISLSVWYGNRTMGLGFAVLSALTWYAVDSWTGREYAFVAIAYWNALVRFAFFLIIVYLLANFHERMKIEREAAETDRLTGALNSRAFYKRAEQELQRSRRFNHPFTIAYIDLDNFKAVNDAYGHAAGDELLRSVVTVMTAHTRQTDIVARIGGDEFAILFAETGFDASGDAMAKLRHDFLANMAAAGWPVTISVGMMTYEVPPESVEPMIKRADELMYQVKKQGKNGMLHQVCGRD